MAGLGISFFIVLLFLWLPASAIAFRLAEDKGYSGLGWGICALLFGPIVVLGAVGLPDLPLRRQIRLIAEKQSVEEKTGN